MPISETSENEAESTVSDTEYLTTIAVITINIAIASEKKWDEQKREQVGTLILKKEKEACQLFFCFCFFFNLRLLI